MINIVDPGNRESYLSMRKYPTVYIMANKRNGTLYVGVTSNLLKRIYEHKLGQIPGFTQRYGCKMLIYYEQYESMNQAINREKQMKTGSRKKKLALVEKLNPNWDDLYSKLL